MHYCIIMYYSNFVLIRFAIFWLRKLKMIRSLDFHVTPHQLRHTYITRLFESGLDIKEIQYLAGHSTIDMTLRVYTHYQHESRKKETAQKVCAALG